jgi:hypothetical protein
MKDGVKWKTVIIMGNGNIGLRMGFQSKELLMKKLMDIKGSLHPLSHPNCSLGPSSSNERKQKILFQSLFIISTLLLYTIFIGKAL